jgi:hypothetical protein
MLKPAERAEEHSGHRVSIPHRTTTVIAINLHSHLGEQTYAFVTAIFSPIDSPSIQYRLRNRVSGVTIPGTETLPNLARRPGFPR